jgi:DNA topoisomerase-2
MAQDFVGSNNLNLLDPSGQFGTRLAGGEDAASPRYIFTSLSPVARHLFPEDDDVLLEYLEDDGQLIEPKHFCPVIPLLLVNGSQGIGTGWSTFLPPHNPLSVLDYIRAKLEQRVQLPQIEPYARGFTGEIERQTDGSGYISYGRIKAVNSKTVLIDELPIGVWTSNYKAHLLKMQTKGEISDFVEDHTTTRVSFKVKLKPSQLSRMEQGGLEKAFRLKTNLLLTNMNAFDVDGKIQKFNSAESIADAYFPTRLSLYHDRKSVLQSKMENTATTLRNKARFIQMVSDGQIDLVGGRISKEDTSSMLRNFEFNTMMELEVIKNRNSLNNNADGENSVEADGENSVGADALSVDSDFDYLLRMPLSSLTREKIEDLNHEASKTEQDLKDVSATKPEEVWMSDLEKLASHL